MRESTSAPASFVCFLLALAGCGSWGTIVSPRADLAFVKTASTAFVKTPDGIERISLDGRLRRTIFAAGLEVIDVSADYATFVLKNSHTDLFVGDARTGAVREVVPLRGRFSAGAIAPDGRRIAASRHADFSLPQGQQVDDDALYLIDVASLEVRTLAPTSNTWPTNLAWSKDGSMLFAIGYPAQRITVSDGARHPIEGGAPPNLGQFDLFESPFRTRTECPGRIIYSRWDTEIRVERGGRTVTIVRESGRFRGFHDYMPDFRNPRWTPDCAEVAFGFRKDTWLASASGSGDVARLGPGDILFFAPPFEVR